MNIPLVPQWAISVMAAIAGGMYLARALRLKDWVKIGQAISWFLVSIVYTVLIVLGTPDVDLSRTAVIRDLLAYVLLTVIINNWIMLKYGKKQ